MEFPKAAALTAEDISALVSSDAVTFLFDARAGTAVARATKTCEELDNRTIACGVEIVGFQLERPFDVEWNEHAAVTTVCRARLFQSDLSWSTVLNLLRPGDRLTQRWLADARNDTLHDTGLTVDELAIEVGRSGPPLVFHVLRHVTTPDDPCRLVLRRT
ncbi:hypothetical protein [Lentzea aerocolonigenes]|uniref:hypothetical protein n=1 Tax=Lentzea aerocolonigenes TaxID=68170 RepID=UPI0004C3BB51|nr:hypothetical protein [Lentzea aerocolonigenes]MCP2242518.1 hypothetical protein [Lentzea aerocolonigenes]